MSVTKDCQHAESFCRWLLMVLNEFQISGTFKKIFSIEIENLKRPDLLLLQDEFRIKRNTGRIFKMESSLI